MQKFLLEGFSMFAKLKNTDSTTVPMSPAQESQYVTELARKQALLEKSARFKYLARNKNMSPSELAGPIMELIPNGNGKQIPVFTTVSEKEAMEFQADKFVMYFFT